MNPTNLLHLEKSPYLRQHAQNPVWWQPWGEAALARARQENKPIFLSVGYSTCHWCHVMEHESFEDAEVARALNESFVSVKVDREERPDVDSIYMAAVQAMRGSGGWPMSVWLLPDGKPFYGGTYFPKAHFLHLLGEISRVWREDPEKLKHGAGELTKLLEENAQVTPSLGPGDPDGSAAGAFSESVWPRFVSYYETAFDPRNGGFNHRPKFPQTMNLQALLRAHEQPRFRDRRPQIAEWVTRTLDGMARGGMFDHLGGGFHRYSVDEAWVVPHFEKMLYDNALLPPVYLEAFQLFGKDEYAEVARATFEYVLRDLTHPDGGFFAAEDADSEVPAGEHAPTSGHARVGSKYEGYFYTFSWDEVTGLLEAEELNAAKRLFGVCREGNFEGRNILCLQPAMAWAGGDDPAWRSAATKLLAHRNRRPRPHLDTKIIAGWNGLMIAAFARGYEVLGEEKYLQAARRAAEFIWRELWRSEAGSGRLLRRWADGEARFSALADDYAYLIHGMLALAEADREGGPWRERAARLQAKFDESFTAPDGTYFQDDGSDPTLLLRSVEDYDGVTPTPTSLMALNLQRLAQFSELDEAARLEARARRIFSAWRERVERSSPAVAQLMVAVDFSQAGARQLVIVRGEGEAAAARGLGRRFLPHVVKLWRKPDGAWKAVRGETSFYLCQGKACLPPVTRVEALGQE
ncbi:MAG: thioredoxin domain-containing protein [Bacteriovoracia bacterium]